MLAMLDRALPRTIDHSMPKPHNRVFVSYSRHDTEWLKRITLHLAPLSRAGTLDVWSDERIKPGANWLEEIDRALASADVAVLLVSPHFLASRFIAENELPRLLQAAEKRGLRIIWVAVSACVLVALPLTDYQAANDPAKPLDSLRRADAEKQLVRIARNILEGLTPPPLGLPEPRDPSVGLKPIQTDCHVDVGFSDIAERELKPLGVTRGDILQSLDSEFRSHPILLRTDYESVPRPLSNGLCVVLSRSKGSITVERLERSFAPQEKFDLWSQMCEQYWSAYKLPFRRDHNLLMSRAEFIRSLKVLGSLLQSLARYIYETNIYHDEKIYPNLHRLKQLAERNYLQADALYVRYENGGADKDLGEVAIALDSVISCVHKIVLEYGIRD
jgi:hypothetical protein